MLYEFDVTLSILGPVLTQSSGPGAYGVDSAFARDHENRPYLPWTLIKGRMREAFEELGFAQTEQWFGPRPQGGGNRANPNGSFVRFNTRLSGTDFVLQTNSADLCRRRRIEIDPKRNAANEQMMQVLESAVPPGGVGEFAGVIRFEAATEPAGEVAMRIRKALEWAGCFGANTTVGFGRLKEAAVKQRAPQTTTVSAQTERIRLTLTTSDPFCVTERRSENNLFESGSVIPGGVIKGALAAQWMRELGKETPVIEPGCDSKREALARHFAAIRFSHAAPRAIRQTVRPSAVPLSVAYVNERWVDYALCNEPPQDLAVAVAFAPDWKDSEAGAAREMFGWRNVNTELRVRTQISREQRRAQEHALFAYEMVKPQPLVWDLEIDVSAAGPDSAAVRDQLLGLLSGGVRGVGKTKAHFSAAPGGQIPRVCESRAEPERGKWIVVLETPALLLNGPELQGKRGRGDLLEAYRRVWRQISGGSLELSHFFARQRLQGGLYLYRRFQHGNEHGYEPYLPTDAGSVFVLETAEGRDREARGRIAQWLKHGLDVPQWALERFRRSERGGDWWSNNPYVPENGFGEVSVNGKLPEGVERA
ncbi:MAG TPA: RAMP superfamily CRISPR-associated protein [Bryobacteraceae bacterium]|nr:RAMP superfamily CRISPR-associated protein [Bryobacteraceae bacterium]